MPVGCGKTSQSFLLRWRRGESNPRPIIPSHGRLHAYLAVCSRGRYLSRAGFIGRQPERVRAGDTGASPPLSRLSAAFLNLRERSRRPGGFVKPPLRADALQLHLGSRPFYECTGGSACNPGNDYYRRIHCAPEIRVTSAVCALTLFPLPLRRLVSLWSRACHCVACRERGQAPLCRVLAQSTP